MSSNQSIRAYLTLVKTIVEECRLAGRDVTDAELVFHTLNGIRRQEFKHMVNVLRCDDAVNFAKIERILTQQEAREQPIMEPFTWGHQAQTPGPSRQTSQQNASKSKNNQRSSQQAPIVCDYCGKNKHTRPDCYARIADEQKGIYQRTRLDQTNQPKNNNNRGRGRSKNTRGRGRKPNSATYAAAPVPPMLAALAVNSTETQHAQTANSNLVYPTVRNYRTISLMHNEETLIMPTFPLPDKVKCNLALHQRFHRRPLSDVSWNGDSGSTGSLSYRKDWLRNARPTDIPIQLAGKNQILRASLIGDVLLKTPYANMLIREVLYSPDLGDNLLSIARMDLKGVYTGFGNRQIEMYDMQYGNKLIAKGDMIDYTYVLDAQVIMPDGSYALPLPSTPMNSVFSNLGNASSVKPATPLPLPVLPDIEPLQSSQHPVEACFDSNLPKYHSDPSDVPNSNHHSGSKKSIKKLNSDWMLWHRKLGHLSHKRMRQILHQGLLRDTLQTPGNFTSPCSVCVEAKMKNFPTSKLKAHPRTSHILEEVAADICGPTHVEAILTKARYVLSIIDVHSRRLFTYTIKTKDQACQVIIDFILQQENATGQKVQRFLSDNALEFSNSQLSLFLRSRGIMHVRTAPHSPQQNSFIERSHQSLFNTTRAILIDAKLPFDFWETAVHVASYLLNVSPHSALPKYQSPMIRWHNGNKIPSTRHHHPYGCMVVHRVPDATRRKLDPKGQKGIFLGYASSRGGWMIYDIADHRILYSRSVSFFDHVPGGTLLMPTSSPTPSTLLTFDNDDESDSDSSTSTISSYAPPDLPPGDVIPPVQVAPPPPPRPRGRPPGTTKAVMAQRRAAAPVQQRRTRSADVTCELYPQPPDIPSTGQICLGLSALGLAVHIPDYPPTPVTYQQAITSPEASDWKAAMDKELTSLEALHVWDIVPRPPNIKIIPTRWVYVRKLNPDYTHRKFKARLVAQGFRQRQGIDFDTAYSPVVRLESIRLLLFLASTFNHTVEFFDATTAYCQASISTATYVGLPPGFVPEERAGFVAPLQSGPLVLLLHKSLYGLRRSGRDWNEHINAILIDIGMTRSTHDPCVYYFISETAYVAIGIFVDDKLLVYDNQTVAGELMAKLTKRVTLEQVYHQKYIGLEIDDATQGTISITQQSHIIGLAERYGLENAAPVKSPGIPSQNIDKCEDSPEFDVTKFQELLGSLMYLAISSRPDIAFCVSNLARYNHSPRVMHFEALKRVAKYLISTAHFSLHAQGSPDDKLTATSDASWDSDNQSRSVTGYVVRVGKFPLAWRSARQKLVALSSCEAEVAALCDLVRDIIPIVGLYEELQPNKKLRPVTVETDSQSAIDLVVGGGNSRSRHFLRKVNFIKQEVDAGNIVLQYVPGIIIPADVLTKNVSGTRLQQVMKDDFSLY
jgi:transposase InsO family protein